MDQLLESFSFLTLFTYQPANSHNSPCCLCRTVCGILMCLFVQQMDIIYKYGNMRQCCKEQSLLMYRVHFLDKSNMNKLTLQPAHSVRSHVIWCTLTCEDLWSPKMCLFPLHTSTPHELTAVADTHTEHSQLPHVHFNSHTCGITVLHYTVAPLYRRRLILNTNTVLSLYSAKLLVMSWPGLTNLISKLKIKPEEISTVTATVTFTIKITNTTVTATTTTTTTTTTRLDLRIFCV
jgi:hypothetical protein